MSSLAQLKIQLKSEFKSWIFQVNPLNQVKFNYYNSNHENEL